VKIRLIAVVLVLLVALLGGAAWWLVGRTGPDAVDAATPTEASPGSAQGAAGDEVEMLRPVQMPDPSEGLRGNETTVAWPVDLELELLRPADELDAPGVAPQGSGRDARLTGRIHAAEGVGVPATLTFVAGLNTGRVLRANAEGWFGATDLYPGLALVRVEGPGIPGSLRELRLTRSQEARLVLGYGFPGAVGGTVFGEGDEPLEDVAVELDGQRSTTNAAGQFVFNAVAGGTDVVLILRKEGYAPVQARIGVASGRTLPADHYRFRMERGASLEVALPTPVGAGGPATVVITPATVHTEPRFAWWLLGPYEVVPGASVVLHDLPPTRVGVRVFHRGARAVPQQALAFLRPGTVERVEVRLEPAPQVRGRVVDPEGLAVPGAEVALEAPDRVAAGAAYLSDQPGGAVFDTELYLPPAPALQRTRSDDAGRFVLTAWEDVAAARYLTARSPDGRLRGGRVLRAGEHEVTLRLEPAGPGRARLEVAFPGRFQGLPVRVSVNGELQPEVVIAPHQDLPLEGLAPGRWRLRARWNGELLFPGDGLREVDLEGTERLEVPLPPGAIEGQDEDTLLRSGRLR
jgi:hypothetical protein